MSYKRLGSGYLQPGCEVNRRYDPADNELYMIVKLTAAKVDSLTRSLMILEQEITDLKSSHKIRKELLDLSCQEDSFSRVSIEEISQKPFLDNSQNPSADKSPLENISEDQENLPKSSNVEDSEPQVQNKRWILFSWIKTLTNLICSIPRPTLSYLGCTFGNQVPELEWLLETVSVPPSMRSTQKF